MTSGKSLNLQALAFIVKWDSTGPSGEINEIREPGKGFMQVFGSVSAKVTPSGLLP